MNISRCILVLTSRKQGFRPGQFSPLVPVQSRTGTNGAICPGSWAQGAGRATWAIGPGSSGPFGPGWWDEPGPMGLAPGPPLLVPVGGMNRDQSVTFSSGSCHQPGLKGWPSLHPAFSPTSPTGGRPHLFISPSLSMLLISSQSENRCTYRGNWT